MTKRISEPASTETDEPLMIAAISLIAIKDAKTRDSRGALRLPDAMAPIANRPRKMFQPAAAPLSCEKTIGMERKISIIPKPIKSQRPNPVQVAICSSSINAECRLGPRCQRPLSPLPAVASPAWWYDLPLRSSPTRKSAITIRLLGSGPISRRPPQHIRLNSLAVLQNAWRAMFLTWAVPIA